MVSVLAALILLQNPQLPPTEEPPRLRTILPNGAIVLVEPRPSEKTISLQVIGSARGAEETTATHGFRHLLEHIMARGPKRDVDSLLEPQGAFLKAQTLRDAMIFNVTLPPGKLDLGIQALSRVLSEPVITQPEIDKEVGILRQELALVSDPVRMTGAAWQGAFGELGLTPLGDAETMAKATPETLVKLYRQQFASDNLVITVSGPVDLDATTAAVSKLAAGRVHGTSPVKHRLGGKPAQVEADAVGDARGAIVNGYADKSTVATLAAALAIAFDVNDSFVVFTPSSEDSLVVAGQTSEQGAFGRAVDETKPEDVDQLFVRGKSAAKGWVERQLTNGEGITYFRGLLLSFGAAERPEIMLKAIDGITLADFRAGFDRLRSGKAVTVVGTR